MRQHKEKTILYERVENERGRSSETARSWRWALLFVTLAATTVIAPMFFWGNASGHDFEFHLASWLDAAGQWRQGVLYPRWAEWANWGYGEPRFIFYPPMSWILGAALGSLLSWPAAAGAYIWLTLIGGGLAMWRLASEWLSSREAVAAALFFAVNPYNLLIVYYRSDFAELLAIAFFPLLVFGLLRVSREGRRGAPFLAVAFAATWLCNAPAAVIATYSVALMLIVAACALRNVRVLAVGGVAMAIGFGLAAFYIVPAAWEQRWVQIAQAVAEELRPERNFIFARVGDPEFILFNWKVSSVAMGMMLITGICAVFVARRRREFPNLWRIVLVLAVAASCMMFAPSGILWRWLPKLRFIQFPWRWLDALTVPFALFAAAALSGRRRQWALWIAVLAVLVASGSAMARDAWWDSDDATDLADWVHSSFGYKGTDEYAPIGCDRYALAGVTADSEQPPGQPITRFAEVDPDSGEVVPLKTARVRVQRWTAERRIFSVVGSTDIELAIRLVNYPAWLATVDDVSTSIQSQQNNGQVVLDVPSGTHTVELTFRRTRDRTIGGIISLISLIGLGLQGASVAKTKPGARSIP